MPTPDERPRTFTVRPVRDDDRPWIAENAWAVGGEMVVSNGRVHHLATEEAYVAERNAELVGFFSYEIAGDDCEVTGALATVRREGVGTALLDAVVGRARKAGCRRVWLVTTNDNLDALGWYQRRGLRLVTIRRGAVDELRATLKPQMPEVGSHGVPLHDEIELELELSEPADPTDP